MSQRRRLIPRSVKMIPAAILSVIMLAILSVLGLFNIDLPSFNDSAATTAEMSDPPDAETAGDAQVALTAEIDREVVSAEATDSTGQTTPQLESLGLVDVLIDGEHYLAATGRYDDQLARELMTLDEIVRAAQQAAGDRAGIKARVSRTFTATAQAEKDLVDALRNAGLQEDEIDQRRTLVSQP